MSRSVLLRWQVQTGTYEKKNDAAKASQIFQDTKLSLEA